MNNVNIFEYATRNKLRFGYKGAVSVEDLWDLDVVVLDEIYKKLTAEKKKDNEDSLLATRTKFIENIDIKIEIVKHIFEYKQLEKQVAAQAKEKKEQKQRIMEILAQKEDESLLNKTPEELKAMLDNL